MIKELKQKFIDKVFNKEAILNELPSISEKLYPEDVLAIHKEFDTASDRLLAQANEILEKAKQFDAGKVDLLIKLGFTQANQVSEYKPVIEKAKLSESQIKLVKYYKARYPLNKFITEEQVMEICYKYNLVCGDISRFKGFVPSKNLQQIASFKLKEEDKSGKIFVFIEKTGKIEDFDWDKVHESKKDHVKYIIENYLNCNNWTFLDSYSDYPAYTKIFNIDTAKRLGISDSVNNAINNRFSLKICAPIKDMDISGLELDKGYKLIKKHIPDPVVLQPVKGGYLILTAWGDEASDPLVVNEINN